ncbi:MAG TPA: DUF2520 domain-containing protein [Gemmatimonadaceae bacterium]|nr:DUF2520 domain-containing protein [Gemmatimonadaceae bacterium]
MRCEPIFVMGAGRAGVGLARAFRASGVEVAGLHGRHAAGGPDGVTVGALPPAFGRASVILVTVRDSQIDDALRELLAAHPAPGAVVLHASGSADPAMLGEVRREGHPAGTFHPLVPLSDAARAAEALKGAYIGVDGDQEARGVARALAGKLGASIVEIPPGEKGRYHAAAVIASNFPAVLLRVSERVLREAGISREDSAGAARALLRVAAGNIESGDPARVLTGPIVRGDADTVRSHVRALASDPEALAVYRALSLAALELARESGTDSAKLAEVRAALG